MPGLPGQGDQPEQTQKLEIEASCQSEAQGHKIQFICAQQCKRL